MAAGVEGVARADVAEGAEEGVKGGFEQQAPCSSAILPSSVVPKRPAMGKATGPKVADRPAAPAALAALSALFAADESFTGLILRDGLGNWRGIPLISGPLFQSWEGAGGCVYPKASALGYSFRRRFAAITRQRSPRISSWRRIRYESVMPAT